MFLDIHSHILHNIDDGAKTLEEALALLKDMSIQGITDVIATPHFYPQTDILDDFIHTSAKRYSELTKATKNQNLPNIHLGCEVFYYNGISRASSLEKLTLNRSGYMLLEPNFEPFGKLFQNELLNLRDNIGITPIIAHIERYRKVKGFKDFITFAKENGILLQVNASSFLERKYSRALKKLVLQDVVGFIATDTHSADSRPPLLQDAFTVIEKKFGNEYKQKLIDNSQELLTKITGKGA